MFLSAAVFPTVGHLLSDANIGVNVEVTFEDSDWTFVKSGQC